MAVFTSSFLIKFEVSPAYPNKLSLYFPIGFTLPGIGVVSTIWRVLVVSCIIGSKLLIPPSDKLIPSHNPFNKLNILTFPSLSVLLSKTSLTKSKCK